VSDDVISEDPRDRTERGSRTRFALAAVLVLLMLLLGVLGWFIVGVLQPAGVPTSASLPPGLEWVRSIYGFGPGKGQQFVSPNHTAIGPDGTIWVTDQGASRVLGFNPDGTFKAQLRQPKVMQRPEGITVSAAGDIYVCDFGLGNVVVFSPDGRVLRWWRVEAKDLPIQVAVKGDRAVVTAMSGVYVFSTEGKLVAKWGSRGKADDQLDLAEGIVIGPDDTLYIADTHNAKIKAFTMAGKLLWVGPKGATVAPKKGGMSDAAFDKSLQLPAGMTFDGNGRLVFVDPFSFQIIVLDTKDKGSIVGRYGDSGQSDGHFVYPLGISYDPARDWFAVADTSNLRVQIVRIPGSSSNALAGLRRAASGGPVWLCSVPLLLLLIALAVAFSGRRRDERHSARVKQAQE
jgi:sugar lactone lactonase YvrE